jgi:uncharacterized membrane protein (DUF485 family)
MANQPTIAELLKDLREEGVLLLREEITLAKKEISEKISSTALNVTYVAGGALVAYCAITFLLLAISSLISHQLLANGVSIGWAIFFGLLIVGLVIGAISVVMIVKGVETLKKLSFVPEKTVETLKEDKKWAQHKIH